MKANFENWRHLGRNLPPPPQAIWIQGRAAPPCSAAAAAAEGEKGDNMCHALIFDDGKSLANFNIAAPKRNRETYRAGSDSEIIESQTRPAIIFPRD